jgi:HlyD family secretion protein
MAPLPSLISIRRHIILFAGLSLILIVGIGGWATTTQIAGAVIASGQLVVESDVKKVQHPTGGVIGQLRVHDGSHVTAGEILIRLDATQTRATLDTARKALDELAAHRARDESEIEDAPEPDFPPELVNRARSDPALMHVLDGEARLFQARVASRAGQKAQLTQRVNQLEQEITGQVDQAAAKAHEIALIGNELKGVRELYAKNLVPLTRITTLERDTARLEGERAQLAATTASTRGKVAETKLQILQVDMDMRTEVGKDLSEIQGKWSEFVEKRIAAEDQLNRIDMRAPQDGTVHQMTVHTVGGLVMPSEPAMLIVPDADRLMVEVKIQPQDIDSVRLGQRAVLRLTAFNAQTTPEITGTVERVSADVSQDTKTNASFYTVRIAINPEGVAHMRNLRLISGMPVEAFLQIGERSALSYLTKPMTDQIMKAWRER